MRQTMVALLSLCILASISSLGLVSGGGRCPPNFQWTNTSDNSGYCLCDSEDTQIAIFCDQKQQKSSLYQGSCVFYDTGREEIQGSWCSLVFPSDSLEENGLFPLPDNVSELNSVVCGNLSREVTGPLCGRCTNNTGPSIYSIGTRCVPCSYVNIIYYLLLQYLPSTLIFLIVIIFRPNITSAPMICYIIFCNNITYYFRLLFPYTQLHYSFPYLTNIILTLSAVWTLDGLIFLSPEFCVSNHIHEVYLPVLNLIATLYPFILLFITYLVTVLHKKNFKLIGILWKLLRRVYVLFYRAWDPKSSMIQAFASLFLISYTKISFIVWLTFEWSIVYSENADIVTTVLYIDPNVVYFSTKHIVLMVFSVTMVVFVFLPPLLILVIYPTSLYKKISHRIQPKWRLRIKTYVEIIQGPFKDGTNRTRDYRSLSGWLILGMSALPQQVMAIIVQLLAPNTNYILIVFVIATAVLAFFFALLHPYREHHANSLTIGLLIIGCLLFFCSFLIEFGKFIKVLMLILMTVPHIVLWGYIMLRLLQLVRKYCHREEGERLLDENIDKELSSTIDSTMEQ